MKPIFSAIVVSAFLGVSAPSSAQTKGADVCRAHFTRAPAARSCELLDVRVVDGSRRCDLVARCTVFDALGRATVSRSVLRVAPWRFSTVYACAGKLSDGPCPAYR